MFEVIGIRIRKDRIRHIPMSGDHIRRVKNTGFVKIKGAQAE